MTATDFKPAAVRGAVRTLAGAYYTSPEIYATEQERIFGGRWVCVGRSEQVAAAGDFMLVEPAGENLIIVRDGDGNVHAHYNVCRHRGTRMCEQTAGQLGETIQCPYHAWTYGLDGRLLTARHMQDTPDFRKEDWPLNSARSRNGRASCSSI